MTRAERPRGDCSVCGKNGAITDEGGMRHHFTEKAEWQAGPDSRKCKGVGQPPAGAAAPAEEDVLGYACRGCNHPVELTANGRSRSHLTPAGEPCPQGSSYPIRVMKDGARIDTKPARSGEVLPAAAPETLRFGDEDPVADFLGTGGVGADPRDALAAEPVVAGQAFTEALAAEVGNPGTVLDRLGYDPRDPEGPGVTTPEELRAAEAEEIGRIKTLPPDERGPAVDAVFDESHKITDSTGVEWVHPGRAEDCRTPECCTHPDGFVYGDDGNGHSGDVCMRCGGERPEPCTHPNGFSAGEVMDPQSGQEVLVWACVDCNELEPWRTPADLLAKMPEATRKLYRENPQCWDCGHRVTPLADRFEPDGSVVPVWDCEVNCPYTNGGPHYGEPCRPRPAAQCTVNDLDEGVFFTRHTRPAPVGELVYRAGRPTMGPLAATVVTAGPYAGRDGVLTDMTEEVTCTDLDGNPRPASTPQAASKISKQQPHSSQGSAPAPQSSPTTSRTTAPSSPRATTAGARPTAASGSTPETSSAPTAKAATSTPSAPMTDAKAAADFLGSAAGSHGESEAEYGRWGRYKLRHPSTGKVAEWTRATTFAKSISDTFTLSQWNQRNVLIGATLRPDIVAAAHGKDVAKDREQLNNWTEELGAAAGNKVAANLGTAVHSWTELIDRNWSRRHEVLRDEVPNEFKIHVRAYIELLEEMGLEPVPTLIEFSTGVLQYEVMGTSDNCYRVTRHLELRMPRGKVRLSPGEFVIGDKKTGKDLTYAWQEICIQLSLYAKGINSLGRFDWKTKTWDTDPLAAYGEPGTKV
ncbi:MAG TPA: hypothetical protein VFT84_01825, partial [Gemmatimonadales bacterium]|nr:hypothetical protein [Gemmatimonadales bacterium]